MEADERLVGRAARGVLAQAAGRTQPAAKQVGGCRWHHREQERSAIDDGNTVWLRAHAGWRTSLCAVPDDVGVGVWRLTGWPKHTVH